jgi:hypothetical protein
MLPFLKQKQAKDAGVITQLRSPDEGQEQDSSSGLEMAMQDFSRASDAKDFKGMAAAFKAAFDILESEPHDEISHEE